MRRDWNRTRKNGTGIRWKILRPRFSSPSLASATWPQRPFPEIVGDQPEPVSPIKVNDENISTEVKILGMTQVFRSNPQPTENRPESLPDPVPSISIAH